jgi:A/G-specific adenine glycosylase
MLQQTQAKTVIPYFNRFLELFPDIASLARAREEDVLAVWAGLGYYRRARNIYKTAQEIVRGHNGMFPTDYETILSLPGIGRYTAGAICSIALNQRQPVVDGNIRRVLARLKGIQRKMPEKYFWNRMAAWVPKDNPSAFNQAIMELGAVLCLPSRPLCPQCPVRRFCRAMERNIQDRIPPPESRPAIRKIDLALLIVSRRGKILLTRQEGGFIPGQWGLPHETIPDKSSPASVAENLSRKLTSSGMHLDYQGRIQHSITHHRIAAYIFKGNVSGKASQLRIEAGNMRWAGQTQQSRILTSSLFKKALQSFPEQD